MKLNKTWTWMLAALMMLAALPAGAQSAGKSVSKAQTLPHGARLTLADCHRLTLQDNKSLKSSEEQLLAAENIKKMSVAEFFPRASANGTYHWMDKNIQLLSDEQQSTLNNLGTNMMSGISSSSTLTSILGTLFTQEQLQALFPSLISGMNGITNSLNQSGQSIVDALDMDFTHLCAGTITITQPVYLGGKLRAVHKAAAMSYNVAGLQYSKQQQDKLVEVDKAYWQVISVRHKKELAEQYCSLLEHLDSNVQEMLKEEVATQADATKVRVKLNEAQMTKTKATNGYELAKMLLFQTVGLDMNGDYDVVEDIAIVDNSVSDHIDMDQVMRDRDELKMLAYADTIAQASVMAARSGLLPNVVVEGSYLTTKPNFFNGYQNEFGGTLAAAVVVNIPIAHASAIYSYKAAKHQAAAVRYQHEEAQEMVELQVTKLSTDLDVANHKLVQAQSNLLNAEENLKLATEGFDAGAASSTDLMGAQTAWLQAKGDVLDADIEIKMSRLYLDQAMGKKRLIEAPAK